MFEKERSIFMRKIRNTILSLFVLFFFLPSSLIHAKESTNSFSFVDKNDIVIDGVYDDWEDYPESYEYNWDNSQNCWNLGVWYDGKCYKTTEGTYDTNVRHKMQMVSNGTTVFVHIIFSRDYGAKFNGEDYQFYIDGKMAAFQVEYKNGGTITNNTQNLPVGVTEVEIRHRNEDLSYTKVNNAKAFLTKYKEDVNMELEFSIPLSEMKKQNPTINLNTVSIIEFFTPNLMYRKISCVGTPTGTVLLGCIVFAIVGLIVLLYFKNAKKWCQKGDGTFKLPSN